MHPAVLVPVFLRVAIRHFAAAVVILRLFLFQLPLPEVLPSPVNGILNLAYRQHHQAVRSPVGQQLHQLQAQVMIRRLV
jgi:hypothetical protein